MLKRKQKQVQLLIKRSEMSRGELEPVLGIAFTVGLFYWFMTYIAKEKQREELAKVTE